MAGAGLIWLDYIDARRRLAHAWHAEGLREIDIVLRFEVDADRVAKILAQPVDPPLPGCSRALVADLRQRVADLERELHRTTPPAERPPRASEFRSLRSDPHVELCGCQWWPDTPRPGEAHNPRCQHAGR